MMFNIDIQRWFRFIMMGAINTAVTYCIYLMLHNILGYQFAYCIAYFLGIILGYCFNTVLVFKVPLNWKGFFSYPAISILQYCFAAILLNTLVKINVNESFAPLLVTAMLVPINYFMIYFMLKWINRQ